MLPEKVVDAALAGQNIGHRVRVDELEEAVLRAGCQNLVGRQLQIEILSSEQLVHKGNHLQDQLILSQIIAMFEDRHILMRSNRGHERQSIKRKIEQN